MTSVDQVELKVLKQAYHQQQSLAIEIFKHNRQPAPLLKTLSTLADQTCQQVIERFPLPMDSLLIATGGYGRSALFPASDIDLLILLPQAYIDASSTLVTTPVERLIAALWDAGLDISSSVRSLPECLTQLKNDIALHTALLDARLLQGAPDIFKVFSNAVTAATNPQTFFEDKFEERKLRHAKYGNWLHRAEPNCKNSPGGLRDLQLLALMIKIKTGVQENGCAFQDWLEIDQATQLSESEFFLNKLRIGLHHLTKRREDRLLKRHQHPLATSGFFDLAQQPCNQKMFMEKYYQITQMIDRITTSALQKIKLSF